MIEVEVVVRKDGEEQGRKVLKYEGPVLDSSDVMQDVGDYIEDEL